MAHTSFPADLPVPQDDGGCDHLCGASIPSIALTATDGSSVDISSLPGLTVLFCYPKTGAPGETVPAEWDNIPGARGCTPHACGFRDASAAFSQFGVKHIFGLSTQDTPYQQEVHDRLQLPYQLLSDENHHFIDALKLPTHDWEGSRLAKRMAFAIENGEILRVWYPVFPPDRNAADVLDWLKTEYKRSA